MEEDCPWIPPRCAILHATWSAILISSQLISKQYHSINICSVGRSWIWRSLGLVIFSFKNCPGVERSLDQDETDKSLLSRPEMPPSTEGRSIDSS